MIIKKKIIYGCDSRGDGNSAYLTRWEMRTKRGSLMLHCFLRSDADVMHDHPWNFWSVVLWPGYEEVTPESIVRRWPLLPTFRPATWRHRVQLLLKTCRKCQGTGKFFVTDCVRCAGRGVWERRCWTLIWTGPYIRIWGFFTKNGWQDWRDYFAEKGC